MDLKYFKFVKEYNVQCHLCHYLRDIDIDVVVEAVEEDVGEDGDPGAPDPGRAVHQHRRVLVVPGWDLPRLQQIS